MSDETAAVVEADPELQALTGRERGAKVREMFATGEYDRGTLAKMFGTTYQQIYQFTKPKEGEGTGRKRVILENGQPRAEYIREQHAAGRSRSDIAKELGVQYQIVYAATKPPKAEEATEETAASAGESPSVSTDDLL